MNNQSNSLSETMVSVQISLSRLDSIANSVNLSQREAINSFADWAEAGTSLARHFHLDNPEALITRIKQLDRAKNAGSESLAKSKYDASESDKEQILLNSISSLSNSLEFLTEALVNGNSSQTQPAQNNLNNSRSNPKTDKTNLNSQNSKKNTSSRKVSAENRQRDVADVMNRDINQAIDLILDFNNTTNRPHNQKFRISCKPLAGLTGRSTSPIAVILKERAEEIESHHEQHSLGIYHNRSRKDENGNNFPPMQEEPEINYQKITEIQE